MQPFDGSVDGRVHRRAQTLVIEADVEAHDGAHDVLDVHECLRRTGCL